MMLFDAGAVVFQVGICLTFIDVLGLWLLVPAVFRLGVREATIEEATGCPPGLAAPRRDRSLSIVYRVLPGHVCVFRRQWADWFRPASWFRPTFSMRGKASWADGCLTVVGRHPVGPWVPMLGVLMMSVDATAGFVRQGDFVSALTTAVLFGGTAVAVPTHFVRSERLRFKEIAAELRSELGYGGAVTPS
jgi:hypothetical protein